MITETVRVQRARRHPRRLHAARDRQGRGGCPRRACGDLLVTVRVLPHEFLHREGDDLHAMAGINIAQAALGGEHQGAGPVRRRGDPVQRRRAHRRHGARARARACRACDGGAGRLHRAPATCSRPRSSTSGRSELLRELGESLRHGRKGDERTPLRALKDWLGA